MLEHDIAKGHSVCLLRSVRLYVCHTRNARLWCWCGSVLQRHCSRLPLRTLCSCCHCSFRSSASQVSLDGLATSFHCRARTMIGRRSFAVAVPSLWKSLPAALRKPEKERCHCVLLSNDWTLNCSTSDVLADRRNVHYHPVLLWRFRDSGAGYETADLLTYAYTVHDIEIRFAPCF